MKITIESEALDTLKEMVEQLQEERSTALEFLEWANGIIVENKSRIGYQSGSPLEKALKFSMKFHSKCTANLR